jgi:hypothetical protein
MKRIIVLGLMIAFVASCLAQEPSAAGKMPRSNGLETSWMLSAQYLKSTDDWGPNWHFNGVLIDFTHDIAKRWAITGELDLNKANGHDATDIGYRIGPRFNLTTRHRIVPFVQFLLGGAHMHAVNTRYALPNIDSTWDGFSWLGGGGVDVRVSHHFGMRGQIGVASVPFGIHVVDRDYWPQYSGGVTYRW